jgi:DNA polymerase II small subunit
MREKLLEFLINSEILVEPNALEYILSKKEPLKFAEAILKSLAIYGDKVVKLEDIVALETEPSNNVLEEIEKEVLVSDESLSKSQHLQTSLYTHIKDTEPQIKPSMKHEIHPKKRRYFAEEYDIKINILKDVTNKSTCQGVLKDFVQYFNDRYRTLKKMLRQRKELGGFLDIERALKSTGELKLIGMVSNILTTRHGNKFLELEDETSSCRILIKSSSSLITDPIVEDEVIGITGVKPEGRDLIFANSIIRPDVQIERTVNRCETPISVAFISDIHIGNKTFLTEQWNAFSKWLNDGEGLASKIKYLVIVGDCVDGIGVYPEQEYDLVVDDIYAQYHTLASLLANLPEHIEIIMLPGNHDAVRPAEPQPTFSKNIVDIFGNRKIIFVGNPCWLDIGGVIVLAYHGRSMDDFVLKVANFTYNDPITIMKDMLKKRHLAPVYGEKTPIAPEAKDYLTIDLIPDIFVTGHVHSIGCEYYKNILLINASTWQSQTAYQLKHNFNPKPCKVPIVDLQSFEYKIVDFSTGEVQQSFF